MFTIRMLTVDRCGHRSWRSTRPLSEVGKDLAVISIQAKLVRTQQGESVFNNSSFLEWIWLHGPQGLMLVVILMALKILHDWLIRTEPLSMLAGIFSRTRRLEKILERHYLSDVNRELVLSELNQRCNYGQIGVREPRLQQAATRMTALCCLRPRYLKPWRTYLTERQGKIIFDKKRYNRDWNFFRFINLPLTTLALLVMAVLFIPLFGLRMLPLIVVGNVAAWYFPWLLLTSPMAPRATAEMEACLERFNTEAAEG